jgi:hypothetical protein
MDRFPSLRVFDTPSQEGKVKKVRLVLDELAVESFSTEEQSMERGTVKARSSDGYMGACTPSESADPGCFCLPGVEPLETSDC